MTDMNAEEALKQIIDHDNHVGFTALLGFMASNMYYRGNPVSLESERRRNDSKKDIAARKRD